jgi:outer membrane protein assembly factor BamB
MSGEQSNANTNTVLKMADVETGEILWVWENNVAEGGEVLTYTSASSYTKDNVFAVSAGGDVMVIDMNTGLTLWGTDVLWAESQLSGFGDRIFQGVRSSATNCDYAYLRSSPTTSENWDTVMVFSKEENGGYAPSIPTVAGNVNDAGDTIIYVQNRQWDFSGSDGKVDLYAFNMSADSIVWVKQDFCPTGNSCIQPPLIYDGKIFFRGDWTVYCFDELTGDLLWQHEFGQNGDEHLLLGNSIIAGNMLIVKTSGDYLYAFDPDNGDVIWVNSHSGYSPSDMIYYHDAVYYSAGSEEVHVVSILDGEEIKTIKSPGMHPFNGSFKTAVDIDPGLRYLYVCDSYFLYCIKIDW